MTNSNQEEPRSSLANSAVNGEERLRRWRLLLGGDEADGTGYALEGGDIALDRTLTQLYDAPRTGGLGASAPGVARWLGDIRTYFPSSVVQVMQQDALNRLGLKRMLLEPELLAAVEVDVNLVSTLIGLGSVIPARTRETARTVVRKLAEDVEKRLGGALRQAINGSLRSSERTRRPRHRDIDWDRTIRANLKHYQADYHTIIPERLLGTTRRGQSLRTVILCVDQSGSMASSVVYSGILACVMASLRSVKTHYVVFDTAVVDLTDNLHDPVDVLFGATLGGGTDIAKALNYCRGLITVPNDTIVILISDLIEGGNTENMHRAARAIIASGANMITLLALDDRGAPMYDHSNAAAFAQMGSPAFACTPDQFPPLIAAAIRREDVGQWAGTQGLVKAR